MAGWLWCHLPIVKSLAACRYASLHNHQWGWTVVADNSKFPMLSTWWSWQNRNWPLMLSALSWLVLLSGTSLVVPARAATSSRAMAAKAHAVPNNSTNHSSTDHIMVNSYVILCFTKWLVATLLLDKLYHYQPPLQKENMEIIELAPLLRMRVEKYGHNFDYVE